MNSCFAFGGFVDQFRASYIKMCLVWCTTLTNLSMKVRSYSTDGRYKICVSIFNLPLQVYVVNTISRSHTDAHPRFCAGTAMRLHFTSFFLCQIASTMHDFDSLSLKVFRLIYYFVLLFQLEYFFSSGGPQNLPYRADDSLRNIFFLVPSNLFLRLVAALKKFSKRHPWKQQRCANSDKRLCNHRNKIVLPYRIVANTVRSALTILTNATILLRWRFTGLRLGTFTDRALDWRGCKIAAWPRFYMAIVHLHIDNFHKFNLCSQFLYLFLGTNTLGNPYRIRMWFYIIMMRIVNTVCISL